MVRVIKNADKRRNLHIWMDEDKGGHTVYCNTNELITLFILRFGIKNPALVDDLIKTLLELDEFLIDMNGDWITYYCKMEEN